MPVARRPGSSAGRPSGAPEQPEVSTNRPHHRLRRPDRSDTGQLRMFTTGRASNYEAGGMVFAGGPDEIADRILHLNQLLGHSRQIMQMDVGGMPPRPTSRPSSCSAPKSCPRSARSSPPPDGRRSPQSTAT